MKPITLRVALTVAGPVQPRATAAGSFGVDAPFLRDDHERSVIPGTQVKGRVRESLEAIGDLVGFSSAEIDYWFGRESYEGDEPERGRIVFSDFILEGEAEPLLSHRIEIDSLRGAVMAQALLTAESPLQRGQTADFAGTVRFFAEDSVRLKEVLSKALRWIPALGGQRTVGFGRLVGNVRIDEQPEVNSKPNKINVDFFAIEIRPQEPFCISQPRVDENLFESSEFIPGGVIKGSLSATLNQILERDLKTPLDERLDPPWTALGRNFSKIRFGHALAVKKDGKRPHCLPLSTVRIKSVAGPTTHDLALCDGPLLIDGSAPRFPVDWKKADVKQVDDEFHGPQLSPELNRVLRVRSAMDSERRRVVEEKLFAYEMIVPEQHVWRAPVDLSGLDCGESELSDVRKSLARLFSCGLSHLGKTKTWATIDVAPEPPPEPDLETPWIVTLQTPALMLPPDPGLNAALVDQRKLFDAYQSFWSEISDEGAGAKIKLIRFFAAQKLRGGGYLRSRFLGGRDYYPFCLTDRGSVFVLEPQENAAAAGEQLRRWARRGLPLPAWASEANGFDWRTCPYVPENGFGEIAVNMNWHRRKQPTGRQIEALR